MIRAAVVLVALAAGCHGRATAPAGSVVVHASRELMSTDWEVSVALPPGGDTPAALAAAEAALDEVARIEGELSPYRGDSELSRVNAAAGGEAVPVSDELRGIVARAVALCDETGGLMDISFLPLGRLWDFHREPFVVPTHEQIEQARALVDCHAIAIDDVAGTLRLPREGMAIGLGALAKGYAVDRASAVLAAAGFHDTLVNGGGDVLARGAKAEGPWVVGIRDPRGGRSDLMGTLPLSTAALVTSGDYERFVEVDGRRYHHILDPRTGWPAEGLMSVSVMDATAERADALATALLAAGSVDAPRLLQRLGVDALLVRTDGTWQATQGITERAELEGAGGL
ncbi:MAG: FAD:protein FMN transferase [Pseudomonadota bacterium]